MSPNLFRFLVVLELLLGIASALLDRFIPGLVPSAVAQAYENEPPIIFLDQWIWIVVLVFFVTLAITSTAGLCFFKRWARSLSLYLTGLIFALYPFLGVTVSSAWSSTLSEMSSLLWGGILVLAYYSPLRERFA